MKPYVKQVWAGPVSSIKGAILLATKNRTYCKVIDIDFIHTKEDWEAKLVFDTFKDALIPSYISFLPKNEEATGYILWCSILDEITAQTITCRKPLSKPQELEVLLLERNLLPIIFSFINNHEI
jgi:hypothetical protein